MTRHVLSAWLTLITLSTVLVLLSHDAALAAPPNHRGAGDTQHASFSQSTPAVGHAPGLEDGSASQPSMEACTSTRTSAPPAGSQLPLAGTGTCVAASISIVIRSDHAPAGESDPPPAHVRRALLQIYLN